MRTTMTKGYASVFLSDSPRIGKPLIHVLVAEAFIGPREQGYEVDHKDGNKLNNSVLNLEYVTPRENTQRAFRLGLVSQKGEKNANCKLSDSDVTQIRILGRNGLTQKSISKVFGISRSHVGAILSGTFR